MKQLHTLTAIITGHSEAIITKDYDHAQQFLNEIDAAADLCQCFDRFTVWI